jgi:hypothetical protein
VEFPTFKLGESLEPHLDKGPDVHRRLFSARVGELAIVVEGESHAGGLIQEEDVGVVVPRVGVVDQGVAVVGGDSTWSKFGK